MKRHRWLVDYLGSKFEGHTIRFRIGAAEPERERWTIGPRSKQLWISDKRARKLVERLLEEARNGERKTFIAQTIPYGEGTKTLTFSLEEFAEEYETIRHLCEPTG
jgi:hypothetical protein